MLNNSQAGDAVDDPFLGGGTSLIAAEATGRVCLGVEIDPLYVDVAVRRWQAKVAILQADRRTFETVAAERLPKAGRVEADVVPSKRSRNKPRSSDAAARTDSHSNDKLTERSP